jgi:broad specificity phosphatase PhoE
MLQRVHLVRHGETEWSLSGQYTGSTDLPLTKHGEKLARELALHLRGIPFARVLSSPRQRARRTCDLALSGQTPEIEPDLAEWDYGDYEGLHSSAVQKERPDWNLFRDGCPHGEAPGRVSARADRLITKLRQMDGNIALFSHGHFGRVLAARWIGLPVSEARHLLLGTASLSIFDYEHDRVDSPAIALWNATSECIPAERARDQSVPWRAGEYRG